jgi:hypothetical protein
LGPGAEPLRALAETFNPRADGEGAAEYAAKIDRPFNFLQTLTWIDFSHVAKVVDAPAELERLLTAVQGRQTAEMVREAICPYRGLDAFREEDSAFFFGRGSADDPNSPIGELVS